MSKNMVLAVLVASFLVCLIGVVVYDQQRVVAYEDLTRAAADEEADSPLAPTEPQSLQTSNGVNSNSSVTSVSVRQQQSPQAGPVQLGKVASLGGKRPLPAENAWNQRIDEAPVDPMSRALIAEIGMTENLHPDFGAGTWKGAPIGIPYIVVSGDQPKVPIVYTAYGDQSDPGPFPIPPNAPIEGHPNTDGDRHVIVLDRDNWKLYELFRAFSIGDGQIWRAESGAVFDLNENPSRPVGWTSADAAGLPIFPGLVRYDEVVEQKEIRHALRFTVDRTRRAFVPPARHWASQSTDPRLPPMGMRVRLKADYDISSFPAEAQVILTALKRYGMILADNGSDWFISGTPDQRWNDDALRTLKKVQGKDFEVVLMENVVAD